MLDYVYSERESRFGLLVFDGPLSAMWITHAAESLSSISWAKEVGQQ